MPARGRADVLAGPADMYGSLYKFHQHGCYAGPDTVAMKFPDGGLNKDLGVPLYHQIQHLIRHRIHSGVYRPGTQIPSEHDLCQELAVSRVTLREALRELVRERLLVKVQGKGTFVSSNPPTRLAPVRYTGFLE